MAKASLENARQCHHQLLLGSYLSEISELATGCFVYSRLISDPYWNYFIPGNTNTLPWTEVEKRFIDRSRSTCILIDANTSAVFESEFEARDYHLEYEEVWMSSTLSLGHSYSQREEGIVRCEGSLELKKFLNVFFASYSGADPKEPYGALPPEYGVAFEHAFRLRKERGLYLYLAHHEGEPAACAMLGVAGDYAFLYGLGVKPQYRRSGFGRALSLRRLRDAKELGAQFACLQTEAGSYNERLFEKFGFERLGTCRGFVKQGQNQ